MSGLVLCPEMLTFEPLRMVLSKTSRPPVKQGDVEEEEEETTLELSSLDHLYDYYNAAALFYDVKDDCGDAASEYNSCGSDAVSQNGSSNGFFKHDLDKSKIKDPAIRLQQALEELLIYYPAAAGRLHVNETTGRYEVKYKVESSSVCSADRPTENFDDLAYGVPFAVAHANTTLAALGDVSVPRPSLDILYPSPPKRNQSNNPRPPVLFVQVTIFACGSFTLALMTSHLLTDGYSTAILFKNLCSLAKGAGVATPMDLANRRVVVKPRVPLSPTAEWHPHIRTRQRGETRAYSDPCRSGDPARFSISAAALETLRSRASNTGERLCSRFQALTALLWIIQAKCFAASSSPPSQELSLRIPINLRARDIFALQQGYMGNAILQCIVHATVQELCESSLANVVRKIASSMVRDAHMQEHVQSEVDYIELQLQNGRVPYIENVFLAINSLVSLPFYDADCGWGRPIYCGLPIGHLAGRRIIVLDDPLSKCWNVVVVLSSSEEYKIFQEEITKFTT